MEEPDVGSPLGKPQREFCLVLSWIVSGALVSFVYPLPGAPGKLTFASYVHLVAEDVDKFLSVHTRGCVRLFTLRALVQQSTMLSFNETGPRSTEAFAQKSGLGLISAQDFPLLPKARGLLR